nr:unnamed protein product [Callosobruchus analis]
MEGRCSHACCQWPQATGKVPELLKALRNVSPVLFIHTALKLNLKPKILLKILQVWLQVRHRPIPKSQKPDDQTQLTKEVLATVNNHFKRPRTTDDRFDIVGKNVATKPRYLTNDQRRLAEKFIDDILFEAEGRTLTPHHKLTYHPPLSNRYHSSSTYSGRPTPILAAQVFNYPQYYHYLNSCYSRTPKPASPHHYQTASSLLSSFTDADNN